MNVEPKIGIRLVNTFVATQLPPSDILDNVKKMLEQHSLLEGRWAWVQADSKPEQYNIGELYEASLFQKTLTRAISVVPEERSVADKLTQSVEKNAEQLLIILGWSQGGAAAFNAAIVQMFQAYEHKTLSGIDYENLFQVGLLDVLVNQDRYGVTGSGFLRNVGAMLEKIGSGSHTNWDYTPEQIGEVAKTVWSDLHSRITAGAITPGDMIYKVMEKINGGPPTATIPEAFKNQFQSSVYNNINGGGWVTDSLDQLSPMSRIVLLSSVIASHGASRAETDIFLTGSKAEIDELINSKSGQDALTLLFSTGAWQNSHDTSNTHGALPPGVTQVLDYAGWIDATYLRELYQNFPPKDLTKEDIKEVNSIGDQVKMLMQSLKYWLTTLRDEQLSIARNISS